MCNIEYHSKAGAVTSRTVEPYCLILKDGSWYVYCFCRLRKGGLYCTDMLYKLIYFLCGDRYFKVSDGQTYRWRKFTPREFEVDSSVIESDVLRGKEICEVILSLEHKALSACEEWLGMGRVAKVGDGTLQRLLFLTTKC